VTKFRFHKVQLPFSSFLLVVAKASIPFRSGAQLGFCYGGAGTNLRRLQPTNNEGCTTVHLVLPKIKNIFNYIHLEQISLINLMLDQFWHYDITNVFFLHEQGAGRHKKILQSTCVTIMLCLLFYLMFLESKFVSCIYRTVPSLRGAGEPNQMFVP